MFPSRVLKQTIQLYASQLIAIGAGFLLTVINTRWLEPEGYGAYSLCFAISGFVELFINFGVYSSGARVLAFNRDSREKEREIVGMIVLVALGLAALGAFVTFGLSYACAHLFDSGGEEILRWFAILFGLLSLSAAVQGVCRGTARIGSLAIFNIFSKAGGAAFAGLFVLIGVYNVKTAVGVSLLTSLLSAVVILLSFSPNLRVKAETFRVLRRDVRSYGLDSYISSVATTASYRTDTLFISYFVGTTAVGFYRLSELLTIPATMMSRSLSTTLFARFTQANEIDRRVVLANGMFLGGCALFLIVFADLIIVLLFGADYESVVPLMTPMALVAVFAGLSQPYNMFLAAKGRGRFLRNIAFAITGTNIVLNLLLIPLYGVLGACYASLVAVGTNALLHYYYYRRTLSESAVDDVR